MLSLWMQQLDIQLALIVSGRFASACMHMHHQMQRYLACKCRSQLWPQDLMYQKLALSNASAYPVQDALLPARSAKGTTLPVLYSITSEHRGDSTQAALILRSLLH